MYINHLNYYCVNNDNGHFLLILSEHLSIHSLALLLIDFLHTLQSHYSVAVPIPLLLSRFPQFLKDMKLPPLEML